MATFIENYRGYAIYYYEPGEYPGYQDDGYSAAGIDRLFSNLPDLKGHIDALLEPPEPPPPEPPPPEPPEPEPPEPEPPPPEPPPPPPPPEPPEEPEFIETYREVDIYWLPTLDMYRAEVAVGYVATGLTLPEIRASIDEILAFLEPPEEPPDSLFAQVVAAIQVWVNEVIGGRLQPVYDWIDNVLAGARTAWEGLVADVVAYVDGVAAAVISLGGEVWDRWDTFTTLTLPSIWDTITSNAADVMGAIDLKGTELEASMDAKLVDFTAWVNGLFALLDPHAFLEDPLGFIKGAFNTFIDPWAEGIIKAFWEGLEEGLTE